MLFVVYGDIIATISFAEESQLQYGLLYLHRDASCGVASMPSAPNGRILHLILATYLLPHIASNQSHTNPLLLIK